MARRRPRAAVIADALSEATAQAIGTPSAPGNPEPVIAALRTLGYDPVLVEFNGDLGAWLGELVTGRFQLVFNLCEGLSNQAAGEPAAAALVEILGLPLTGASSDMLGLCLRKDRANAVLYAHGVPVPEWMLVRPDARPGPWRRFPAIVKPAGEDGSFGIASDSVVSDRAALGAVVARGCPQWGPMLVQRYVGGREFNLAIVGGRVLPHAEIDFSRMDPGLPAVVTYAAKWEHGSPEDRGTVPRCPARLPARLAARLTQLAGRVWAAVDGTGYGRIDVRVDGRGTTFVTDVNPNPDLGVRAGLARQAAAAGWSYLDLIARIVEDALARARRASGPGQTPPAALADARRLAEGMPYTQRLAPALGRREPRGTRST
ncbi:MAG TPA: D-alanine--D-alanine ligase [Methylomirabilota bacterium]|jgi:D-alanine-D-alanine ligase